MSILRRHFPRPKTVKIEKQKKKTYDCLEHKVLPSFKLKRIKTVKIVPKWPRLVSCLPTVIMCHKLQFDIILTWFPSIFLLISSKP